MPVKRCETMYFVRDFAAAVDHYEHVLGLQLVSREDWGFAAFDVEGHPLGLMDAVMWQEAGLEPGALPAPRLSLQVDDLEAEVARLRAAGADVDAVEGEPGTMRGVDLRDGFGNRVFVWESGA